MKIFDRQMLIGFLLGALIGLGAAAPTNEDTEAIEERGALEPRACAENNCLRALLRYSNQHAATSFCGDYIPKGVYTTIQTTYSIYESLGQFSPVITTDYTSTFTYTNYVTIGAIPPPFGQSTSTSSSVPAPTPTFPPFLKACDFEAQKISKACSCIIASVSTVLEIENLYIEDIWPYTLPWFEKDKKKRAKEQDVVA